MRHYRFAQRLNWQLESIMERIREHPADLWTVQELREIIATSRAIASLAQAEIDYRHPNDINDLSASIVPGGCPGYLSDGEL